MSRIRISGVIVPSCYDMEWFSDDIVHGTMTPLSVVERQLAAADTGAPLTIAVNSPGGSVFSANEMVNAIRDWKRDTGQTVSVEVGAMAASAAGMISVMLGPVKAHRNSRFMFHGAEGIQIGGADAMRDEGQLLDSVNAEIQTALVTWYGFDPDQVAVWFSEGRMGWVGSGEALAHGLVTEILDGDADPLTMTDRDRDEYSRHGLGGIAAILSAANGDGPMDKDKDTATVEESAPTDEGNVTETEASPDPDTSAATITSAHVDMAYEEGYAAGEEAAAKLVRAEMDDALAEKTTALTEATAKIAEYAVQVRALEMKVSRLDRGFRSDEPADTDPDPGATSDSGDEYWRLVAELREEGVSQQAAMLQVQRQHPQAHAAMIEHARTQESN